MLDQTDQANWQRLLRRIKDRRRTVDSYLRSARPRAARLTYVKLLAFAWEGASLPPRQPLQPLGANRFVRV